MLWGRDGYPSIIILAPFGEKEEEGVTAPEPRKRPTHTPLFLHLRSWRLPLSWARHPSQAPAGFWRQPLSDQGVAGSLALRWVGTPGDL